MIKKRDVTNTGPNRPFRCLDLSQFISFFFQTVWGLNHVDEVFVRIGVIMKKTSKKYKFIQKIPVAPLFRSQQMIQREKSGLRLMVLWAKSGESMNIVIIIIISITIITFIISINIATIIIIIFLKRIFPALDRRESVGRWTRGMQFGEGLVPR